MAKPKSAPPAPMPKILGPKSPVLPVKSPAAHTKQAALAAGGQRRGPRTPGTTRRRSTKPKPASAESLEPPIEVATRAFARAKLLAWFERRVGQKQAEARVAELEHAVEGYAQRNRLSIEARVIYQRFLSAVMKAAKPVQRFVEKHPDAQDDSSLKLREIVERYCGMPSLDDYREPWAESTRVALLREFGQHPAWPSPLKLPQWACLSILAGHWPNEKLDKPKPWKIFKAEQRAVCKALETVSALEAKDYWEAET